jgi:hypothetical protein
MAKVVEKGAFFAGGLTLLVGFSLVPMLFSVIDIPVGKNGLFAPFIYKMHHFTKTGSGQT